MHVSGFKTWVKLLIIGTISLLGIAIIGGYALQSTMRNMSEIRSVHSTGADIATMSIDIAQPIHQLREVSLPAVLAPDKKMREKIIAQFNPLIKTISDNLDKLEAVIPDEGRPGFNAIVAAWGSYVTSSQFTINEIKNGYRESAFVNVNGDEQERFDELVDSVKALSMKALQYSSNIFDEAKSNSQSTITVTISIIIITILVLSFFCFWMARLITKPLYELIDFTSRVQDGDLTYRTRMTRKDEIGSLATSFDSMVDKLQEMIATSEQKSLEAQQESEKAREATSLAEMATKQAEQAKAEGMLQAAQQLESIVEIITSASEELSAQIEQSSKGSEEQAHCIDETTTSMEEMNSTVLEVAKNASNAATTADQAKEQAEEGATLVTQVVRAIEDVQKQSQEMKHDMGKLGQQADGIGQVLNVISDIADQTNLLALNAAIEAARAGEAGRGFAVVADEVRKLAEKTMTATKEVEDAIRGIQNGAKKNIDNVELAGNTIENVTQLANTSGESLRQIVSLAEMTTDQVRSIATASEEQASTSEEISRNLEDVNRVSQEAADAMRQSSLAVNELADQAQRLKSVIETMKSERSTFNRLPAGKKIRALSEA